MSPRQPFVNTRPRNDKEMAAILSYGKHYYNYVVRAEVIVITEFYHKIILYTAHAFIRKAFTGPKTK